MVDYRQIRQPPLKRKRAKLTGAPEVMEIVHIAPRLALIAGKQQRLPKRDRRRQLPEDDICSTGTIEPNAIQSRPQNLASPPSLSAGQSDTSPQGEETENTPDQHGYIGRSGFMFVYNPEAHIPSANPPIQPLLGVHATPDIPSPELQQGFIETYYQYCHTWCPVLDRNDIEDNLARSPLLANALALAASRIQPPASVLQHTDPVTYYNRAQALFYENTEPNLITCLQTIILFYWWSPRAPTTVHRDSTWWWTGIAIRQAQQMGLHREQQSCRRPFGADRGLCRRIWWTLFARERLTAITQGRPLMIDPDDCDVSELTLDDFPCPSREAEIFIHWVSLCAIIGRVGKYLLRPTASPSVIFPSDLAQQLVDWVQSLPNHLMLPISGDRTVAFHRDVHQLYLPYLTVIILLHLDLSSQPRPESYSAAAIAASCIARIMKDYLVRGGIRFLTAITCWYCGVAALGLLHVRRIDHLTASVDEDLDILKAALGELKIMWPSANMYLKGLERLWSSSMANGGLWEESLAPIADSHRNVPPEVNAEQTQGIQWINYFPFVKPETSGVVRAVLSQYDECSFMQSDINLQVQWPDLFDIFDNMQYMQDMPSLDTFQ
ncbi:fungal-specific transcription factor domain-containing protein [Talaromyces proteolyticus]|uniref:Fungal-specific transcription factor domain-containing protein n=1 Tax=Talaromyces proteolyticus TaxID=1131652 RepID=A0AAD4KEN7_9EURO|nr:fungal-specific transcription factor domain-containing protein [Talaromyces proteolyticus]KAH8689053.1 fungal-specific transcription factor domain-containing protein [Talaromyces proteolyticus]